MLSRWFYFLATEQFRYIIPIRWRVLFGSKSKSSSQWNYLIITQSRKFFFKLDLVFFFFFFFFFSSLREFHWLSTCRAIEHASIADNDRFWNRIYYLFFIPRLPNAYLGNQVINKNYFECLRSSNFKKINYFSKNKKKKKTVCRLSHLMTPPAGSQTNAQKTQFFLQEVQSAVKVADKFSEPDEVFHRAMIFANKTCNWNNF